MVSDGVKEMLHQSDDFPSHAIRAGIQVSLYTEVTWDDT